MKIVQMRLYLLCCALLSQAWASEAVSPALAPISNPSTAPMLSTPPSEPKLTFMFPDDQGVMRMRVLSLSQIRALAPTSVSYMDPLFAKPKQYLAVPVKALFDLGFGKQWRNSTYSDVEFASLTQYKATASTHTLKDDGGYIAIEDKDAAPGLTWEPFPTHVGGMRAGISPGPFYVLWLGVNQTEVNDYVWFWQLRALKLLRFEEKYPKVVPVGVAQHSDVYAGYVLFKDHCLRCHSLDRQGGKVGPDLGAPRNVTTYRDDKTLFGFIKKTSAYRYTKMPDFDQTLTDADIQKIITFLKAKAKGA